MLQHTWVTFLSDVLKWLIEKEVSCWKLKTGCISYFTQTDLRDSSPATRMSGGSRNQYAYTKCWDLWNGTKTLLFFCQMLIGFCRRGGKTLINSAVFYLCRRFNKKLFKVYMRYMGIESDRLKQSIDHKITKSLLTPFISVPGLVAVKINCPLVP